MSWVDSRKCLLCQTRGNVATLFRFPPRPEIKKQWASFCNMDPNLLTTKDCLCINHFTPDQIVPRLPTSKKTKLRLTAVPSIMKNGHQTAVPCRTENTSNQRMNESVVTTEASANSSHPPSSTFIDVSFGDDVKLKSKKKRGAPPLLPSKSASKSARIDVIDSEEEELGSLVDYEKITVIDLSSLENPAAKKPRRTVRYIGDVTAEHLTSHEDAVKYFFFAKNALEKSRRKITILNKRIVRLTSRVKKYQNILKQNGERKEDEISDDDDFTWPLEDDTEIDPSV